MQYLTLLCSYPLRATLVHYNLSPINTTSCLSAMDHYSCDALPEEIDSLTELARTLEGNRSPDISSPILDEGDPSSYISSPTLDEEDISPSYISSPTLDEEDISPSYIPSPILHENTIIALPSTTTIALSNLHPPPIKPQFAQLLAQSSNTRLSRDYPFTLPKYKEKTTKAMDQYVPFPALHSVSSTDEDADVAKAPAAVNNWPSKPTVQFTRAGLLCLTTTVCLLQNQFYRDVSKQYTPHVVLPLLTVIQ